MKTSACRDGNPSKKANKVGSGNNTIPLIILVYAPIELDYVCCLPPPAPPPPLFTHMGHEEEVPGAQILVHSWHPHLHNMILSVDTEGSLHAWQWEEES